MTKYNKAVGSGLGGIIGFILSLAFVATFNAFEVTVTPDTQASLNQLALAIGTGLGGLIGTYAAPKNR